MLTERQTRLSKCKQSWLSAVDWNVCLSHLRMLTRTHTSPHPSRKACVSVQNATQYTQHASELAWRHTEHACFRVNTSPHAAANPGTCKAHLGMKQISMMMLCSSVERHGETEEKTCGAVAWTPPALSLQPEKAVSCTWFCCI